MKNTLTSSVMLSVTDAPAEGSVAVKVIVQPLIVWLWIGGAVMAVGSVMAAFPGKRRRPIDPVSARSAPPRTATAPRCRWGRTREPPSPVPR